VQLKSNPEGVKTKRNGFHKGSLKPPQPTKEGNNVTFKALQGTQNYSAGKKKSKLGNEVERKKVLKKRVTCWSGGVAKKKGEDNIGTGVARTNNESGGSSHIQRQAGRLGKSLRNSTRKWNRGGEKLVSGLFTVAATTTER